MENLFFIWGRFFGVENLFCKKGFANAAAHGYFSFSRTWRRASRVVGKLTVARVGSGR